MNNLKKYPNFDLVSNFLSTNNKNLENNNLENNILENNNLENNNLENNNLENNNLENKKNPTTNNLENNPNFDLVSIFLPTNNKNIKNNILENNNNSTTNKNNSITNNKICNPDNFKKLKINLKDSNLIQLQNNNFRLDGPNIGTNYGSFIKSIMLKHKLKNGEDVTNIKSIYSENILNDIKNTIIILKNYNLNYNNLENVKLFLYSGILNAMNYLTKFNCQKIQVFISDHFAKEYYYNKKKNKYSINIGYNDLKENKELYFRFVGNNEYDDKQLLNYTCSCNKIKCDCTKIISNDKCRDFNLANKNNILTFLFDNGNFKLSSY